jgi:IS605 OrfB family transposase
MQFTFELGTILPPSSQERAVLLKDMMQRYCSAKRVAYNSLLDGKSLKEIIHGLEERRELSLNWRYCEHAARDAAAEVASQRELAMLQLSATYDRMRGLQERIDRINVSPNNRQSSKKLPLFQKELARLQKRKATFEANVSQRTVPRAVFGSRRLFVKRAEGIITNGEWKQARDNQLHSIGQANQGGNANIKISKDCGKVGINIPCWAESPRTGKDGRRYRVMNARHWFELQTIRRPGSRATQSAESLLETGGPYSVRLVESSDCFVHVKVSSEITPPPSASGTDVPERVCSLDQNPFGVAATIVRKDGNLLHHRTFPDDRLVYASRNKRDDAVGKLVKEIITWAHAHDAYAFVIEDLDIRSGRDFGRKVNRVVYNFVRRHFAEGLMMKCWKEGNRVFSQVPRDNLVRMVNPAYTSQIGKRKYRKGFGLSVHEAAAFCIGRRYYGFGEKLDEPIMVTTKSSNRPRERVPVRYVWASLYGYAGPTDPYREPPRRKGSRGANSVLYHQAVFTGRPASGRTPSSASGDAVRKGGERGGSPRATGNGVEPASMPSGVDGKVFAASFDMNDMR